MPAMRSTVLSALFCATVVAIATGCSSCVTVKATYGDAWDATRDAMLLEPDLTPADLVERFDTGSLQAVVRRPAHRDELHYLSRIEPAGGQQPVKRKVCVRVQELDPLPANAERMKTQRRPDIEARVADRIEQALGVADEAEQAAD
jgi:hypothetical protein